MDNLFQEIEDLYWENLTLDILGQRPKKNMINISEPSPTQSESNDDGQVTLEQFSSMWNPTVLYLLPKNTCQRTYPVTIYLHLCLRYKKGSSAVALFLMLREAYF